MESLPKYDPVARFATMSGFKGMRARLTLIFQFIIALRRLKYGVCPECNSDAPGLDNCYVCKGWTSTMTEPFPPTSFKKEIWLARWYKKRYDRIVHG